MALSCLKYFKTNKVGEITMENVKEIIDYLNDLADSIESIHEQLDYPVVELEFDITEAKTIRQAANLIKESLNNN
jgi:hypothetical protein